MRLDEAYLIKNVAILLEDWDTLPIVYKTMRDSSRGLPNLTRKKV